MLFVAWRMLGEAAPAQAATSGQLLSLEVIHLFLTLLIGVAGITVLWIELRARRRVQEQEIKIAEQHLALQERELDFRKSERTEFQELMNRERRNLMEISVRLSERIADNLRGDTRWAAEALERAKLAPQGHSLFADRLRDFSEEKNYLAKHFSPLLIARIQEMVAADKKVVLLIDSGTTVYPFFGEVGRAAVRAHQNQEAWVSCTSVISNNVPGVQTFAEEARTASGNRHSPLALECRLLPGSPLPPYFGVTGQATIDALKEYRASFADPKRVVFIGLVSGNWIRLRRTPPACPLPLARGVGHLELKQAMIDMSDEVYVISPLGKIFANVSSDTINATLGLTLGSRDPERAPYGEVDVSTEKASVMKLVSTSRTAGRLLGGLTQRVHFLLSAAIPSEQDFATAASPPHVLFPFDRLPTEEFLEKEIEFPHANTRDEAFMRRFFYVKV